MTPTEFAKDLERKVEEIRLRNRPFQLGVASAHAMMIKRIFTEGKDVNLNSIGQYSTEDIYINPSKTATRNNNGFSPLTGKTGKSKFKDGKSHVTSFFEGWKGFRDVQGLNTDVVNLNNTGDMKSDFERTPQQINVNYYEASFSRPINDLKARGNEDHFNKKIFSVSKKEIDKLLEVTNKELRLLFES